MASLARSRGEILAVTKSILDLVNKRQKLSLAVSKDKELLGEAIANPEVEKRLLAEAREYARSIQLNEQLASSLVSDLIRYSKLAQATEVYRRQIRNFLELKKIHEVSIVGAGRMGCWFAKYFRSLEAKVFFYDEKPERAKSRASEITAGFLDSLEKVVEADLVIISVPISKTPKVVREISKVAHGNPRKPILLEISSVKSELAASGLFDQELTSDGFLPLFSIHPLFGAAAHPYEANTIIQSSPKDTTLMRGLFPQFVVISLDWKDHDQLMSLILTLPHVLALAFAGAIRLEGDRWPNLVSLNAPSFTHLLDLSRKVLNEDPDVYFEIQASNPNSKLAISELMKSLLQVEKSLKNRPEFLELFRLARHRVDALDK
jgi:prephenate dehydrogenase/chorismate mutase